MNLIQAIVCLLSVSLVASQIPTFSASSASSSSSVVTVSSTTTLAGTLVTFSAAGWIVSSDIIAATPTAGAITFIVTPLLAAGSTSVGLIQTAGTGSYPAGTPASTACGGVATAFSGKTTLEGGATSSSTCFSDFASLYTGAATATTTDTAALQYSATGNARLVVGLPTTVVVTPATTGSATACHQIAFTTVTLTTVQATTTTGTCPTTLPDTASALKFISGNTATFGFYINAGGKAAVCLQTTTNYLATPACGYGNYYGKSSSILSVLVAPILVISAIFLN